MSELSHADLHVVDGAVELVVELLELVNPGDNSLEARLSFALLAAQTVHIVRILVRLLSHQLHFRLQTLHRILQVRGIEGGDDVGARIHLGDDLLHAGYGIV